METSQLARQLASEELNSSYVDLDSPPGPSTLV